MAESILVTGKKISSMELVTNVTGNEKIPTGQPDDLAVTPNQIADHTIARGDLASHGDLSQVEVDLTTQIATLAGDVATADNSIRGLIAAEEAARIAKDLELQQGLSDETVSRIAADADLVGRVSVISDNLSSTVQTFTSPEAGVDPVTGVADGAYFNVRSSSDETYEDEYQNVGGVAVATGKSHQSTYGFETQDKSADTIKDASGLSQQEINDASVVAVDSIADLLALAEGWRKKGLRYEVQGFYADSLKGGGSFKWDPHHNKSLHNGITVLDPNAASAWDGTVGNINALFDHSATGSGCYIRLNEERIPISASGAVEGGDLYQHLKAAVRVNAKFSYDLKDGYINSTTPINLSPLGIDMRGEDKENRISISTPMFNLLGDAEKLILTNMTMECPPEGAGQVLSGAGGDRFIKRVIVDDNVIRGGFRLTFWNGGGVIDPNVTPYGILYLSLSRNEMYDITRSFAVMASLPVKHAQVVGNTIRNFSYTFLNLGVLNEHTISASIKDYNELLMVEDNTVICDDDFYGAGNPYYAFIVTENLRTIYRGNHVEGMKSLEDAALYDIYASSDTFESSDNTYKNNVCLNPSTIWPLRALCKVKGGRSEKFFRRNKYIIDDDIHERWGVDEDLIIHSLADYRELGVEISDCEFKLKSLATRSSASSCDYLRFTGNTITVDKIVRLGGTASGELLSALPINSGKYIFKDNDLHIRYLDQVTNTPKITLFRANSGEGEAVFMRNSLTTDDPLINLRLYDLSFAISQRSKDVGNFVGSSGNYSIVDAVRTCGTVGGLRVNMLGDGVGSGPILYAFPGASELTLTVGTGVSSPILRVAAPPEDGTAVAYTLRCEAVFLGSIHRIAVNLYTHRLSGEAYFRYRRDSDGLWVDQKEATGGNYSKIRLLAEDVIGDATLFNISNWNGMGVRLAQGEVPHCTMKWEIVGELIPSSSMPDVG